MMELAVDSLLIGEVRERMDASSNLKSILVYSLLLWDLREVLCSCKPKEKMSSIREEEKENDKELEVRESLLLQDSWFPLHMLQFEYYPKTTEKEWFTYKRVQLVAAVVVVVVVVVVAAVVVVDLRDSPHW